MLNKSTAFSQEERKELGLEGLLPDKIESIDLQMQRVLRQLGYKTTDYERYIFLMSLLDHNETLFYKTIMSNPAYFLPIIYDPTIGEACLKFDVGFRQARGMYLSIKHKGRVKEILKNWPQKDVRFICVTDGGRILGLGDLGANGMGIPIGKLQLYTAAAAVPPHYLLPLYLDAGTNNETLLRDPLYLGLKETRPSQQELYAFVDEFVEAVQQLFPLCCIHFEDWTGVDAVNLLARYRDKVCCFNDDIQGTAAITLTGLINALKIKKEKFSQQKILFLGAGSAGVGIANLITSVMVQEGLSLQEAQSRIALFDVHGLLESKRKDLFDFQKPYAHPMTPTKDFVQAINLFKPTAIIGVSTVGGAFTQEVVEAMTHLNKRPIIFALSNPTEHAECTPSQAYQWSNGKAIYAAGVQFDPVHDQNTTYYPGQANNFYIFPAVGMAILATQAKRVTDAMFIEAAHAIADAVSEEQLAQGSLYPLQSNILAVELKAAERVAQTIFDHNLSRLSKSNTVQELIAKNVYRPEYAVPAAEKRAKKAG
jgi:malate dehydrogenase (oxaloacetate-decarboxylating)(NADP+)